MLTSWKKTVPTFMVVLTVLQSTLAADDESQISRPTANAAGDSPATYQQELQALLGDDSPWILPRAPQADGQAVTADSYQQDLQGLLMWQEEFDSLQQPVAAGTDTATADEAAVVADSAESCPDSAQLLLQNPTPQEIRPIVAVLETAIVEQAEETSVLEQSLARLGAIGEIQIGGPSTNAPEEGLTGIEVTGEANRYLKNQMVPPYYLTAGYGVRQAPRNTLRLCHNPLYFEDPNLERCGRSHGCLTTAHSALQFVAKAFLLPYMTAVHHPHTCVQALPDCPTCHEFSHDATWPAWSLKGALAQGAAITGATYIIP